MSAAHRLRVAWRVLRAEGAAAVRDRTWDRLAEAARRRSYSPMPPDWRPEAPIPVLLVTSAPPVPWLGGVPTQLRTRLEAEARGRSIALLYPLDSNIGAWRLEVLTGAERWFLEIPGAAPSPVALDDAAFEGAVRRAAERVGARAVQAEGLAGLPPASLLRLAQGGFQLILSLHDFAAFSPLPHEWPLGAHEERRALAAELLSAAGAVIFPSDFLRRFHLERLPAIAPEAAGRWHVLEPPIASTVALPRPSSRPLRHVAFVGSVQPHKGSLVFAELVRRLAGAGLRWSAYGGGDAGQLRALRRLGVRVRGYYRSGSLPGLLRRDGVDLALLPSVGPESHNLALSECVVAGVPVLAFALGAVAERVPALEAGRLVPLELGAEGIAATLRDLQRDGLPAVPDEAARLLADPVSAAAGYLALYRELGLV
ncbi:MAG TPA: glycosyltransferase [Thermoanaerobaculia bacterium]|nr:glycosyltransferase [Thermoanaerobaculia bacterium]